MEQIDFLSLNVLMAGAIILAILLYLIFLIKKRREEKFLHDKSNQQG